MHKLKSSFSKTQGLFILALQLVGIASSKDMPKKMVKNSSLDNFSETQKKSSMYTNQKLNTRKPAKSIRIINNYSTEISTVELKKGNVHIKLVPLSASEQQRKRVSGYKYLTV